MSGPIYRKKKSLYYRINHNKLFGRASSVILPLMLGVLIFVLWQTQILHAMLHTDTFTLPLPSRIACIIAENQGKIWVNTAATLTAAITGLIIGSFAGYGIAVLAAVFPRWGAGGLSIVTAFNAIPIVALAPVMTNWTKDVSRDAGIRSMAAKILVVVIVCIANMSINAYRGLTELPAFSEDLMAIMAAGKKTVFRKLRVPNSIPYVFTALKVSVPSSVITALVSEYFAEYVIGVGRQIRENIVLAQYSTAWAYISVACLIGIVMYALLMFIQGIVLKHRGL